jgi:plasmid maintenance system antidote protein VapI
MAMYNSPHPGEFVREVYLEPNGIPGRQLSDKLGVSASTLARVLW